MTFVRLTRRSIIALIGALSSGVASMSLAGDRRNQSTGACTAKAFFLDKSLIKPIATGRGGCLATDRITVGGAKVGYMYREAQDYHLDSGWRFFAGDEDDRYLDEPCNSGIYDVNTIANYDPLIVPLLDSPVGSAFVRAGNGFKPDRTEPR